MAREAIEVKRYVVRLTGEERAHLEAMLRKGKHGAKTLIKARILLKADVSGNYPPPFLGVGFAVSREGVEDCLEGVCAVEPCSVYGCAHVGLSLCGPHGAKAVGDFSLDHAGPELSL
jgi:hypothetical protein